MVSGIRLHFLALNSRAIFALANVLLAWLLSQIREKTKNLRNSATAQSGEGVGRTYRYRTVGQGRRRGSFRLKLQLTITLPFL